ncbi:MAG TPA: NAD-dependent epimerase/dehydratase family protein [Gaiellaceae bacterium]|jgi:nucleoside-diphosphate-sugar epimerase
MRERWLVTGALGCIGAWTAISLVREGARVVAFDLGDDLRRLRLIGTPHELDAIDFVRGDITELATVERVLAEHDITHVVHLAALQVPFCRENPVLGSQVNVTGTVNVFEAVRRLSLETTIAYASSAAVYDRNGRIAPGTLYGVFKLANEGTARIYAEENGLASVGLRPFTVYGPGRDQGMTAGPTLAIAAAVRGEPYRIAFGGATQLHYAADVARAFVRAARSEPDGARTYCIGGPATSVTDFVALVEQTVPGAQVTHEETVLPFPDQLPEPWFDSSLTPLDRGVRETVEILRSVV